MSVIIPLYNKADTIRRAIDSALPQEGVHVEVIVIDDGSTDGSGDQVRVYGDRIVFRRQPNAGPSVARNEGVKLARYSLIAFLDADDQFLPGCLLAHVACRRQRPDTEISLMSFRVTQRGGLDREEKLTERVEGLAGGDGCAFVRYPCVAGVINVHVGGICVNRDLFDRVGGFDSDLPCWEVTDFLYRLSIKGSNACFIGQPGLVVHVDPENSQFQRTHKIPMHAARFAHRLLAGVAQLPGAQRKVFLDRIGDLASILWDAGALEELKRIAAWAEPYGGLPRRSRAGRLAKLGALSLPILRVLWRLRARRTGNPLAGGNRAAQERAGTVQAAPTRVGH